jgi:hypothetical protein
MLQRPIIGVIGSGQATPEQARLAEQVGALLARRGAVLLTGGLGGVMEAASRGASGAGGLVLGLLPGADPREANPHVGLPLATGLGEARNLLIATASQALIAVGGALGTLAEIAFALKAGRTVIGLATWPVDARLSGGSTVLVAGSAEEAAELALAAAHGRI